MSTSDSSSLINQLPVSVEMPREFEEFREIASLYFKRIVDAVNKKEGSLYYLQELGNFQSFFTAGSPYTFRNVYRMTVNFGALPNAATKSVAHGIVGIDANAPNPSSFSFTHIYATASKQTAGAESFVPIPWADSTGGGTNNIQITVDATNVNITTSTDWSAYTVCYVILEYLKQ
jgi:hypothetical protein